MTKPTDLSAWTPRPPVDPDRLDGRLVTLERWNRAVHAAPLWAALDDPAGPGANALMRYFPNRAFGDAEAFADWIDAMQGGWRTLVFRRKADGVPVGMASYMRNEPAHGVVEVGAVAHGPAVQRTPLVTEAHFLMASHVFDTLGYRRYEWKLDDRNAPSHAAARRLGFSFEGVFRNHMVAKGENRDTAWYAMTDADWPTVRAALDAWLAPANFDAAGRQVRSVEAIRAGLSPARA